MIPFRKIRYHSLKLENQNSKIKTFRFFVFPLIEFNRFGIFIRFLLFKKIFRGISMSSISTFLNCCLHVCLFVCPTFTVCLFYVCVHETKISTVVFTTISNDTVDFFINNTIHNLRCIRCIISLIWLAGSYIVYLRCSHGMCKPFSLFLVVYTAVQR